jgi:hypothetical protein
MAHACEQGAEFVVYGGVYLFLELLFVDEVVLV